MKGAVNVVIGFVLIIGIGGLVYWQTRDTSEPVPVNAENDGQTPESSVPAQTGNTQGSEGITLAEVARHKDAASCWSSINGNVYDLTSWIPKHPGGPQAILQLCGTDGSAKFNAQHGGAQLQAQILAGFKIGVLKK
jgi:cytochrome b involved in lipid metabolism